MAIKGTGATYLRRSKDKKERGRNVAWQKRENRQLAKFFANEDLPESAVYADNDMSASLFAKKARTDWQRLLLDIEHGPIRRLYSVMVDRITRLPKEIEKLIDLANRGLFDLVIIPNPNYDDDKDQLPYIAIDLRTPEGVSSIRGMVNNADIEVRNLSIRLKRTARRLRAEGKTDHGVIAVGFKGRRHGLDNDAGEVIEETEAERLRIDARRWVNGVQLSTIALEWSGNVEGLPMVARPMVSHINWRDGTKTAQTQWTPGQVRNTLTNPRNAGLRMHKGEVIGKLPTAIYDAALWADVQNYAEGGTRGPRATKRSKWTGWVICAGKMEDGSPCGAVMLWNDATSGAHFKCVKTQGRRACGKNYCRADALEDVTYKWLLENIDRKAFRALLASDSKGKLAALNAQAKVEERRQACDRRYGRGGFRSEAAYDRAIAEVDADEAAAQAALRMAGTSSAVEQYLGKGDALAAALANTDRPLSTDEHRALLLGTKHRAYIVPNPVRRSKFDPKRIVIGTEMPEPKDRAA